MGVAFVVIGVVAFIYTIIAGLVGWNGSQMFKYRTLFAFLVFTIAVSLLYGDRQVTAWVAWTVFGTFAGYAIVFRQVRAEIRAQQAEK